VLRKMPATLRVADAGKGEERVVSAIWFMLPA
jgi:hypothetical protein